MIFWKVKGGERGVLSRALIVLANRCSVFVLPGREVAERHPALEDVEI